MKTQLLTSLLPGMIVAGVLYASENGASEPQQAWSPFGVGSCHINNRSVQDNARWIPEMQAIGITTYRTPHCNWGSLEREKGKWSWENLDAQMNYLDQRGFEYGCLVIGNPRWNQADPPGHLPVNNVEGWSNYVTKLCERVKGRATRLEIWNEPPNFTGKNQTPADYAKLVVAADLAAKKVDPSFRIGLAAKSVHVNYLEQTIRSGAKTHFDYVVLHPYEVLDGVADNSGSEAVFLNIVPTVRRMLDAVNPEKRDVPVIFTELGVSADKGLDTQAHALVKAYTLSIAQGVECLQWFEGRDGDSGPMGLLDRDGKPRPTYHALGSMIENLGTHPKYLGWTRIGKRGLAFAFESPGETVLVAWGQPGNDETIEFASEVWLVDPLHASRAATTNRWTPSTAPMFVLKAPQEIVAQAKANRNRPLDWGGDYSQAREVSVVYGEQTVEKGLHTRAGADVAKAVVAYGGSARAGDVPGGNAFVVDPQFLCYTPEPIEITVEVRRNPENVNAGFKLVYESPEGFKTAGGWYTIPDNKQWHTKTWRIDDPQFVNYWGYNFLLQSDGNQYNKYLIRRVTVRKIDE